MSLLLGPGWVIRPKRCGTTVAGARPDRLASGQTVVWSVGCLSRAPSRAPFSASPIKSGEIRSRSIITGRSRPGTADIYGAASLCTQADGVRFRRAASSSNHNTARVDRVFKLAPRTRRAPGLGADEGVQQICSSARKPGLQAGPGHPVSATATRETISLRWEHSARLSDHAIHGRVAEASPKRKPAPVARTRSLSRPYPLTRAEDVGTIAGLQQCRDAVDQYRAATAACPRLPGHHD